jgi:hypothetical protein
VLLPELRRKGSSAKLKAKAEKTSAAIYFDYPGTGISTNKDARNKGIIFTKRDARKYILQKYIEIL